MSERIIWVWVRTDGEPACLLQVGSRPRGPGDVIEVRGATGAADALRTVAVAARPEPDEDAEPAQWLGWRKATKATRAVAEEEFGG